MKIEHQVSPDMLPRHILTTSSFFLIVSIFNNKKNCYITLLLLYLKKKVTRKTILRINKLCLTCNWSEINKFVTMFRQFCDRDTPSLPDELCH